MDSTDSCIKYCSSYHYSDGEFASQIEGEDESCLSWGHTGRSDAMPLILITTFYYSRATRDRSGKQDAAAPSIKAKYTMDRNGDVSSVDGARDQDQSCDKSKLHGLPEDLADSVPGDTYMTIYSKELLNVLRDVITYYHGCNLLGEGLRMIEPYQILGHHREELRAYQSKHPQWHDEAYRLECNRQLAVLSDFLDRRYGRVIEAEKLRWARKAPVCTFEHLWLLFKPGEVCYLDSAEGTNAYITQEVYFGGPTPTKAHSIKIVAWNIDYDGYMAGGCSHTIWIPPFEGEKEINSLEYYPARFHKDSQKIIDAHGGRNFQKRLIARGRTFWDLARDGPCYRQYNGDSATTPFKKVIQKAYCHF